MKFAQWRRVWELHANTPAFARAVEQAKAIARNGGARGRLYVSVSGGKDSVALLGIVREAGIATEAIHVDSALALPESRSVAEEACARVGFPITVWTGEGDPFAALAALPADREVVGAAQMSALWRQFAAGDQAFFRWLPRQWDGGFTGVRADENQRTRGINLRTRGTTYEKQEEGRSIVVCSPLAWWSARDVFAFIVARGFPVHPFYRRCADELGMDPELRRIDWAIAMETIAKHGGLYPIRRLYPDLWRRLVLVRPELSRYA